MTVFTVEIQLYALVKMLRERFALLNANLKSSVSVTSRESVVKYDDETDHSDKSEY